MIDIQAALGRFGRTMSQCTNQSEFNDLCGDALAAMVMSTLMACLGRMASPTEVDEAVMQIEEAMGLFSLEDRTPAIFTGVYAKWAYGRMVESGLIEHGG